MVSVVDFFSEVNSIIQGGYTMFPRYTLMRMASLERKEERIERRVHNLINKIGEDEKKGSINELKKDERAYIKKIVIEEKIEDKEVRGEEQVELNILNELKTLGIRLRRKKINTRNLVIVMQQIGLFTKEQFNDLVRVAEGQIPWANAYVGIMKYDIGECSNIAITSSRDMRDSFGKIKGFISEADSAKDQKGVDENLVKLRTEMVTFIKHMEMHFYVMLRLFKFMKDELMHETDKVKKMEIEGLPAATAKSISKALDKAFSNFKKKAKKERGLAQKLIQEEMRAIATVKD